MPSEGMGMDKLLYYFDLLFLLVMTVDFVLRLIAGFMSYEQSNNPKDKKFSIAPRSLQESIYVARFGGVCHLLTLLAVAYF